MGQCYCDMCWNEARCVRAFHYQCSIEFASALLTSLFFTLRCCSCCLQAAAASSKPAAAAAAPAASATAAAKAQPKAKQEQQQQQQKKKDGDDGDSGSDDDGAAGGAAASEKKKRKRKKPTTKDAAAKAATATGAAAPSDKKKGASSIKKPIAAAAAPADPSEPKVQNPKQKNMRTRPAGSAPPPKGQSGASISQKKSHKSVDAESEEKKRFILFVGNLDFRTTAEQVKAHFGGDEAGCVEARIRTDKESVRTDTAGNERAVGGELRSGAKEGR